MWALRISFLASLPDESGLYNHNPGRDIYFVVVDVESGPRFAHLDLYPAIVVEQQRWVNSRKSEEYRV